MMPTFASSALPTSADPTDEALVDTSVAIAIVLADHADHEDTLEAVRGLRLGLAGHAWFETYSVLTRLPPGQRRSPEAVHAILAADFPLTRFVHPGDAHGLAAELARLRISGGSVYDALVGATARDCGMLLLSRDRRARATYDSLGVRVRMIA